MPRKRKRKKKGPSLSDSIDLHNISHDAARRALIRKIEQLWGSDKVLEIITGNSPRMKEVAKQVLMEYKLGWVEGDVVNSGYLKTEVH